MKLLPVSLPQLPAVSGGMTGMDSRLPPAIALPFPSTEMFWRQYPSMSFTPTTHPPPSPAMDFKTHLPSSLASDPRLWSREDVASFLRWAEGEFDLKPFNMEVFQMNGKALCLLTKVDLNERCPGAGDVLHNVLAMLARDFNQMQRCLPSSPVTPTRSSAYPLSPHSHPPTPTWAEAPGYVQSLTSLMSANSVTLSPAPSVDSQSGSPSHATDANQTQVYKSDSDEDNHQMSGGNNSPPITPTALTAQRHGEVNIKDQPSPTQLLPQLSSLTSGYRSNNSLAAAREFFGDPPEPNTNGRLLWDFLQQLLNDQSQRYKNYIAWKDQNSGTFKIVDPPGLARLWGIQKNHLSMNYDKMSRALRYYYRVNILRKVQGERHCYQFLRNSQELKNIKNISSLRHQMRIKLEPEEEAAFSASPEAKLEQEPEADMPTDLSMSSMNQPMSEQQQQPLSLHDPPAKYRSHAYNLVKTNQEPEERK